MCVGLKFQFLKFSALASLQATSSSIFNKKRFQFAIIQFGRDNFEGKGFAFPKNIILHCMYEHYHYLFLWYDGPSDIQYSSKVQAQR